MTRVNAFIVLALFSISVGSVWCALIYRVPMAAMFALAVFVICAVWLDFAEQSFSRMQETKKLTHYTWRKKI